MTSEIKYPNMVVHTSDGITASERYLVKKCKKTFMALWSYPNPYKREKGGKELCDVLALFDNHIFIFSDKYCDFASNTHVAKAWNRWYNHAVAAGANQILGAERWLRGGGEVCLDAQCQQPFPLPITINEQTKIYRIIVARGATNACKNYFHGGSGSLMVNTGIMPKQHLCNIDRNGVIDSNYGDVVFRIGRVCDEKHVFHVFDDFTLDCVMNELDTVSDFIEYLDEKEKFITDGKVLMATGEEDLLAQYLMTMNNDKHAFVSNEEYVNYSTFLLDDLWEKYISHPDYATKHQANKVSYVWDALLDEAFSNMQGGKLTAVSHPDYASQNILFARFAKPCRVYRRELGRMMVESNLKAREAGMAKRQSFCRRVIMESSPDTLFVFYWMNTLPSDDSEKFRSIRKYTLEQKMLSYIPSHPNVEYIIGVAQTTNLEMDSSQDFALIRTCDFDINGEDVQSAIRFFAEVTHGDRLEKHLVSSEEYSDKIVIENVRDD